MMDKKEFEIELLSAAAKSGHESTIRLAAQLAGVQPCNECGFVWTHCRCNKPKKDLDAAVGFIMDTDFGGE